METKDYLKDIQDIKNMMSKSSQFLSLSGLSGILAGIYCLVGAYFANTIVSKFNRTDFETSKVSYTPSESNVITYLFIIAILVISLSIMTALILSASKAKKQGEDLWNESSKQLVINFGIPLIAGGIVALILLQKENYELISPVTLLFYGLGCVNASRNTFRDIRSLGITLIIIGLLATYFTDYGLLFWGLGFGVCHILYGSVMYFKYERN